MIELKWDCYPEHDDRRDPYAAFPKGGFSTTAMFDRSDMIVSEAQKVAKHLWFEVPTGYKTKLLYVKCLILHPWNTWTEVDAKTTFQSFFDE
jgi:hypothetical protein